MIQFLTASLFLLTTHTHAPDWKLAKEKEGVRIYTRESEQSKIKEIKAEALIEAPLEVIVNLHWDVDGQCEWLSDCESIETLKTVSSSRKVYYMEIAVPFPFEDRDLVQSLELKKEAGGSVKILLKSMPDYLEDKGNVRIKLAEGFWKLIPVDKTKTRVEFEYLLDPAGSVPSWLTNLFIVDGPLKNILAMREQAKMDKYQKKMDWELDD